MTDIFITALFAATLALLVNLAARFVFARVDETTERFNEVCQWIHEGADLASDYWLKDSQDDLLELLEVRVLGYQNRINLGFTELAERYWTVRVETEDALDLFFDQMTEGDFQVKNRSPDYDRAVEIQLLASELILAMRSQRRKLFSWL